MEGISHRTVAVNGINMHVAEKGEGPVVLFLHGFPELWYSWRHQIISLAARGYHAIAPDLRGYGDTDAPPDTNSYTILHVVGDLIALMDALDQDKVFVVGHDWGALVAWALGIFRPDRVRAMVNLSVVHFPRDPAHTPVDLCKAAYGEDHYVVRFQEPGVAEAKFASMGYALVFRMSLTNRSPEAVMIPKDGEFETCFDMPSTLPSWLSEKDINYFASKYEKSGFTGGLNYYRCLKSNWELMAPWTGAQVKVPVKFLVGDLDPTYYILGVQDYIHKGEFKRDVPLLEDVVIMEGVGHFINQERPHEIADHIYEFIQKF